MGFRACTKFAAHIDSIIYDSGSETRHLNIAVRKLRTLVTV